MHRRRRSEDGERTAHEPQVEREYAVILGEDRGRDDNVERVWRLIMHVQEVQCPMGTSETTGPAGREQPTQ